MKKYKDVSKIGVFLMTFGLLLSGMMIVSDNAHAWDGNVSVFPARVIAGKNTTFQVNVKNSGSNLMKITELGIKFEWMGDYKDYNGSLPSLLDVGASKTFNIPLKIPYYISTDSIYKLTVKMEAADKIGDGWSQEYPGYANFSIRIQPAVFIIQGYIRDVNGAPVPNAIIKIDGNSTKTNAAGYYKLSVNPGTYTLEVDTDSLGYTHIPITITDHDVYQNVTFDEALPPNNNNLLIGLGIVGTIIIATIAFFAGMYITKKKRNKT